MTTHSNGTSERQLWRQLGLASLEVRRRKCGQYFGPYGYHKSPEFFLRKEIVATRRWPPGLAQLQTRLRPVDLGHRRQCDARLKAYRHSGDADRALRGFGPWVERICHRLKWIA